MNQFTEVLKAQEHIPAELIKFVSYCIERNQTNRLIQELIRDAASTANSLNRFFEKASQLSGLSPTDVLRATGFSWRDLDPSRIESAIAQLRAIFFLDQQGFTDVTLVPTQARRSSDIVAKLQDVKYAVEVINSIYDASERFSSQQLADWAFSRIESEGKKSQIATTSMEQLCVRGALVAIISTKAAAALQTHNEFIEAAKLAWEYSGAPANIHICMVTGRETLGYGPDDAVYPSWPAMVLTSNEAA